MKHDFLKGSEGQTCTVSVLYESKDAKLSKYWYSLVNISAMCVAHKNT